MSGLQRSYNAVNLQQSHDDGSEVPIAWPQGIPDSVTAAAWHPTQENVLALGCADGAVAVLDTVKGERCAQY